MLRLTGKYTEHRDGEGGPADIYNCPLVTKPYRDPASADKLKMLYPQFRVGTTVTLNFTPLASIFCHSKSRPASKSHIFRRLHRDRVATAKIDSSRIIMPDRLQQAH